MALISFHYMYQDDAVDQITILPSHTVIIISRRKRSHEKDLYHVHSLLRPSIDSISSRRVSHHGHDRLQRRDKVLTRDIVKEIEIERGNLHSWHHHVDIDVLTLILIRLRVATPDLDILPLIDIWCLLQLTQLEIGKDRGRRIMRKNESVIGEREREKTESERECERERERERDREYWPYTF